LPRILAVDKTPEPVIFIPAFIGQPGDYCSISFDFFDKEDLEIKSTLL
jgi:hypothetical protein